MDELMAVTREFNGRTTTDDPTDHTLCDPQSGIGRAHAVSGVFPYTADSKSGEPLLMVVRKGTLCASSPTVAANAARGAPAATAAIPAAADSSTCRLVKFIVTPIT